MSEITRTEERSLDLLAEEINEEHRKAEAAMTEALVHARNAGRGLNEAKDRTEHGEWGSWVDQCFEGSRRTARTYQRIARNWEELSNRKRASDLSIRGAVRLLRDGSDNDQDGEENRESWLVPQGHEAILTTPRGFDELARVQPSDQREYFWVMVLGGSGMAFNWKPVYGEYLDVQLEACGFPVKYGEVKLLGEIDPEDTRDWNQLAFDTRGEYRHAWRESWGEGDEVHV